MNNNDLNNYCCFQELKNCSSSSEFLDLSVVENAAVLLNVFLFIARTDLFQVLVFLLLLGVEAVTFEICLLT